MLRKKVFYDKNAQGEFNKLSTSAQKKFLCIYYRKFDSYSSYIYKKVTKNATKTYINCSKKIKILPIKNFKPL